MSSRAIASVAFGGGGLFGLVLGTACFGADFRGAAFFAGAAFFGAAFFFAGAAFFGAAFFFAGFGADFFFAGAAVFFAGFGADFFFTLAFAMARSYRDYSAACAGASVPWPPPATIVRGSRRTGLYRADFQS
jgi:hypothetical protein